MRTTLDLRVHQAGAQALEGVDKPASLVALRPSTGEILAVVHLSGLAGHHISARWNVRRPVCVAWGAIASGASSSMRKPPDWWCQSRA